MIFRQTVSVGLNHFIHHFYDVIQGQHSGGMRIKHGGMVDVFAFFGASGFDCQKLRVYVCHIERRKLERKLSDIAGLDATSVYKTRYLNACLRIKV